MAAAAQLPLHCAAMGVQDRDWYRDAQRNSEWRNAFDDRPLRGPSDALHPVWIAVAIVLAMLALYHYLERQERAPARSATPPAAEQGTAAPRIQHAPPVAAPRVVVPAPRPREEPPRAAAPPPATRTVYLCKGYSGGMFWSSGVCSAQRATIDRMVTVPGHLSWDEQVEYARRERQAAEQLYAVRPPSTAGGISRSFASSPECAALEARLRALDDAARRPQSASEQDRLREERRGVRDRQAELRC